MEILEILELWNILKKGLDHMMTFFRTEKKHHLWKAEQNVLQHLADKSTEKARELMIKKQTLQETGQDTKKVDLEIEKNKQENQILTNLINKKVNEQITTKKGKKWKPE